MNTFLNAQIEGFLRGYRIGHNLNAMITRRGEKEQYQAIFLPNYFPEQTKRIKRNQAIDKF